MDDQDDFLPRICDPAVVDDVFKNGRKAFEVGVSPTQLPTMPIEFSVAAYRLGHSMVRAAYNWNAVFDDGEGTLKLLFDFSGTSGILGGDFPLPSIWIADFRRLYNFGQAGRRTWSCRLPSSTARCGSTRASCIRSRSFLRRRSVRRRCR